jgi:hypothetical protein
MQQPKKTTERATRRRSDYKRQPVYPIKLQQLKLHPPFPLGEIFFGERQP